MSNLPDVSGGGLIKGVWFVFHDGANTIRAWVSSMSGMERVYVNDELVVSKRSAGLKSEHDFVIGDDVFKISFEVLSVIKGKLLCSLGKNNTTLKTLRCKFNNGSYGLFLTLIVVLAFVAYIILNIYFYIPRWSLIVFVVLLLAGRFFRKKQALFLVEEISKTGSEY